MKKAMIAVAMLTMVLLMAVLVAMPEWCWIIHDAILDNALYSFPIGIVVILLANVGFEYLMEED